MQCLMSSTHLCECRRTRRHKNLTNPVVKSCEGFVVNSEEALSRSLLGDFILQVPYAIFVSELLIRAATFGQNSTLKSRHVEQEIRIVLTAMHKKCFQQCTATLSSQHQFIVPRCKAMSGFSLHSLKPPMLDTMHDGAEVQ